MNFCSGDRRDNHSRLTSENGHLFSHIFRRSNTRAPHLKVGVLLDDTMIMRCFADVLEDIKASNFAVIDAVIFHSRPESPTQVGLLPKIRRRAKDRRWLDGLLYTLYLRWDARKPAYPLELVDCTSLIEGAERIEVQPITK